VVAGDSDTGNGDEVVIKRIPQEFNFKIPECENKINIEIS